MNFLDAIKSVYSNYATFKGRSRRSEFWWFFLFFMICFYGAFFIVPGIAIVFYLGSLVPYLAVLVRRLQDAGKPWYYMFIPIYNIILLATDSQPGDNEYGPNPKTGISQDDLDAIGNN